MTKNLNLGLLGWPLAHSLSPALHQAALNVCGWSGRYNLYPFPSLPEGKTRLLELLDKLRSGELDGLNVTIPHKLAILPFIDESTPTAHAVGAVNTIIRQNNKLVGENTDVAGFSDEIKHLLDPTCPGTALVLGAGGAARAVVYALACSGWQVYVFSRRLEQAKRLVADFHHLSPPPIALSSPFDAIHGGISGQIQLLVNATPAGMSSNNNALPWPEHLPLPDSCFVYDLIYEPPVTVLLRKAKDQGLPTANGLGMLVKQAARSFVLWAKLPETDLPKIQAAMQDAVFTREEVI